RSRVRAPRRPPAPCARARMPESPRALPYQWIRAYHQITIMIPFPHVAPPGSRDNRGYAAHGPGAPLRTAHTRAAGLPAAFVGKAVQGPAVDSWPTDCFSIGRDE